MAFHSKHTKKKCPTCEGRGYLVLGDGNVPCPECHFDAYRDHKPDMNHYRFIKEKVDPLRAQLIEANQLLLRKEKEIATLQQRSRELQYQNENLRRIMTRKGIDPDHELDKLPRLIR